MEYNCLNCDQIISRNFCDNCGQKRYRRLDRKYIWDEIQYSVLHTNKGLLYSVKNLIKNPGKTAREFIDGNRVNHYKPLLLVFVLSGISAFISFKIIGLKEIASAYYSSQNMNSPLMNDYLTFVSSYNSIIMLLLIPLFAIITKLAFRKWGHNYYEHMVMNAYILAFYTLVNIILLYPLMYIFKSDVDVIMTITSLSIFTIPLILTWFFKEFYYNKPFKRVIGRVLIAMVWIFVGSIVLMIFGIIFGFVYAMINGPEAMEYLKPQ